MAASATRANGLVNGGFLIYQALQEIISSFLKSGIAKSSKTSAYILIRLFITCSLIVLPFCLWNYYGYVQFCRKKASTPQWCSQNAPLIYSHVQNYHWNLGFMKYYQFRKIPNFFLSSPTFMLTIYGCCQYLIINKSEIATLGFCKNGNRTRTNREWKFTQINIFVYVIHALILSLFAALFMHIEVVTRFLMSSSPFPYWIMASFVLADYAKADKDVKNFPFNITSIWPCLSRKSKIAITYFSVYNVLGTVLHVNFLPWT